MQYGLTIFPTDYSIQPAELAKLGFILVLAWYLTRVEEKVRVTYNGVIVPIIRLSTNTSPKCSGSMPAWKATCAMVALTRITAP